MAMDNGELEFSDEAFPNSDHATGFPMISSLDTILDDVTDTNTHTCTHTHTCNPPGRDKPHTHTCYHSHTQFSSTEQADQLGGTSESLAKKKRPSGNREAVKKYREKQKAHTAYLEDKVQKLRSLNEQLWRKVQDQVALEAEAERLRAILFEFKGKIDSELGSVPYQKPCSGNVKGGDCSVQPLNGDHNLRCETDVPCFHPPF